ncbi:DUF3038 domain-containing protein [Tumidithrix helvetica PCC 7403]|uniref:DUF3038 domain-containing protein n=1 Tax=Tumidithrix helvetica TaxID=3457545 RepID=UPI003C91EBC9
MNPERSSDTSNISPDAELAQLQPIKAHLDLVLLALEALTGIGSEAMLQAAEDLGLHEVLSDRITLWRLRQASPLRKGKGGRKKLDVDEARAMTLISGYLAVKSQFGIRNAVAQLEKCTANKRPPYKEAILGDYLDQFNNLYQERMAEEDQLAPDALQKLALKLLIDLLFYSSPTGSRHLWVALLERSRS